MGAVDIAVFIGAVLFALGGAVKLFKPDFRILGLTLPCCLSRVILGAGLVLKAVGM
ncbi:MAG TPA: hypothetical protein VMX15_04525 [Candidatus Heimdallarchaeota archaeon]|nr:hypothetical protein [Candidatus Heimdallarchaeota archaeon]